MSALYSWGIDVIKAMQALGSPVLTGLFKGITFVGNEEFYLLLLPFLFWCLDTRLGSKLAYLLLIASFTNYGLKELFAEPRPFLIEPGINLIEAGGYGFPSGHAQMAVVIWGTLAWELGKKWGWVAALTLMLLIGTSRVYLGAHFPTDVLAGWVIGAVILSLVVWAGPRTIRRIGRLPLPLALVLINGCTIAALLLDRSKDSISFLAAFWGFAHGHLFLSQFFPLSTTGSLGKRIVRYPVGLIGIGAIYLGLKALFPAEGEGLYLVFRFIRYALLGLWVGLAAPLLFWLFSWVRIRVYPRTDNPRGSRFIPWSRSQGGGFLHIRSRPENNPRYQIIDINNQTGRRDNLNSYKARPYPSGPRYGFHGHLVSLTDQVLVIVPSQVPTFSSLSSSSLNQ